MNRVIKYAGGNRFSGTSRSRNGVRVFAGGRDISPARIEHTSVSATWTATLKGPTGKYVTFDYGDGSAPETKQLGPGGTSWINDYSGAGAGTKVVRIYGDLNFVTSMQLESLNIFNIYLPTMPSLLYMLFFYNDLSTINFVTNAINLDELQVRDNDINNLSPIVKLVNLTFLHLRDNSVSDISPIIVLDKLDYIRLDGNPVEYPLTGLSWFTATFGTFYFNSTVDSSDEVDQWLIDLAAADWSNAGGANNVYLDGTNPERTSASDAAVAVLIGNGVILHLN